MSTEATVGRETAGAGAGDKGPIGTVLAGFVPGRHPIDAYGRGGFRFAGMSHRGSVLLLPSGVQAWDIVSPHEITQHAFDRVFADPARVAFMIVGTGLDLVRVDRAIEDRFREAGVSFDVMQTGAAARTYNILLAENRLVGAALLAVD